MDTILRRAGPRRLCRPLRQHGPAPSPGPALCPMVLLSQRQLAFPFPPPPPSPPQPHPQRGRRLHPRRHRPLPLLRHVARHVRLAHRGPRPVFCELHPLWRRQGAPARSARCSPLRSAPLCSPLSARSARSRSAQRRAAFACGASSSAHCSPPRPRPADVVRRSPERAQALRARGAGDDARALPQLPGVPPPQGARGQRAPGAAGKPTADCTRPPFPHNLTSASVPLSPPPPPPQEVVVSPALLHQNGIPFIKLSQKAREARSTPPLLSCPAAACPQTPPHSENNPLTHPPPSRSSS